MIRIALIAIVIIFVIGAAVWLFFGGPLSAVAPQQVEGQPAERVVMVEDIIEDPIVFEGLNVEVTNQVSDWISKNAFKLGRPGGLFGAPAQGLLVIREEDFKLPKNSSENEIALGEEGSRVLVRGTVRIMSREQVQEALEVDLEKTDIGTFEETTVLVANRVERLP